jgi:hypothetical protein
MTPFKAIFGVNAFDFDAEIRLKTMLYQKEVDESLADRIRVLEDELYRRGIKARSTAAKQYNRALKEVQFNEGDRVLRFHPPALVQTGRKFRSPWLGPYRIKEKLPPIGYMVELEVSSEVARIHVNRLRRFSDDIRELGFASVWSVPRLSTARP